MGHILSGVDTIVLVYMAAARDSWNSSELLCTSRAQVLATKNVSNYAFIMYATARRPVESVGGGQTDYSGRVF
jgi:hypothetical protein